jgi:hypothetical protein
MRRNFEESDRTMKEPFGPRDTANLIERFLDNKLNYPQEWNDFIESRRVEAAVEPFRKLCYELDPLVNTHLIQDLEALTQLRNAVSVLRTM